MGNEVRGRLQTVTLTRTVEQVATVRLFIPESVSSAGGVRILAAAYADAVSAWDSTGESVEVTSVTDTVGATARSIL